MSQDVSVQSRLVRWSWGEIRHGQLWPVSVALTLIIACIFALSALAQRMEQVIVKQGKDALTADTVYTSSNPLPDTLLSATEGLQRSIRTRFATMAFSDQGMQLITVKAVDSQYPLKGTMLLESNGELKTKVNPGELWLDPRIASSLDVKVGDNVTIGDAELEVSGLVKEEPGLSFNPFQQMPTAFIHQADIDKTGAVQLGSRVRFNLYLVGDEAKIAEAKESVEITPSDRWRDKDSGSRTNDVFERTEQYLSLTVAIVIIMAATTLVLTCQHYVQSRVKTIAMLKSLGAKRSWIARWLSTQVLILLLLSSVLGSVAGIILEYLLRIPLVDLLPSPLPSYGVWPFVTSIITAVLIAVPALGMPLLKLMDTSAASVMQEQAKTSQLSRWWLLLVPVVPMLWVYKSNTLVWLVLAGIVALFAVLALLSIAITKGLKRIPLSTAFQLALSRINRSNTTTGIQFGALALSLMLLATIWLVRTDLLSDWQRTLPADAHNAFALNIAGYEKQNYLEQLDQQQIDRSPAYPIIRGRLTEINDQDAQTYVGANEEPEALSRELNFTWGDGIPEHNELLEGQWTGTGGVSIEVDVAESLGVKVGDKLGFVINSQKVEARVNSIRFVEWRDMKPNFYFIFTPDLLQELPSTWLVSFRLEDQNDDMVQQLSRNHPTVSLMDIRGMGQKIQGLLEQLVWAITILAGMGVIAGVLLIYTLLRLSMSQRQQEVQLYRTLGASKKRINATIWAEYGLMAAVAGIVATMGAELVVASLMNYGFDTAPTLHLGMWFALPAVTFGTLFVVSYNMVRKMLMPVNKQLS